MTDKKLKQHPSDLLYALDIGTRNVVGLVMRKTDDDEIQVIDFEMLEHPDRAMYDGQIHDIEKVAKTVQKVTRALEERLSCKLTKVAIAAAGRALKTSRVRIERAVDNTEQITKNLLDAIEMEGIQMAQHELETVQEKHEPKYYSVGYSVMQYELDGAMILNPLGHRGSKLGMEIIATFLPHIVVDSLYTVVDKVGLEVLSMTLEPIAAIQVAIPQKFRLLNLALIDVGAGTSDIALTRNGTVFSYGMVSVAGDEMTEALANTYLLDFESAERVKTSLKNQEVITFTDIVGITYSLSRDEIIKELIPTIRRVVEQIASKVLEYNEKAPSAVFCIGGGCQVPEFTTLLSEALNIPKERTVIKSTDSLEGILFDCDFASGPEYITPVGIGYTAFKDKEQDFITVTLNEKNIRLLNSRPLTVSDALILVGYPARRLIPEKGKGLKIMVEGKEKTFQGEAGEPAKILLNTVAVGLDHFIKHKDNIKIEAAIKGVDAKVKLKEIHEVQLQINVDRKPISMVKIVQLNGKDSATLNTLLESGDQISCTYYSTLRELLVGHNLPIDRVYMKARSVLSLDDAIDYRDTISVIGSAQQIYSEAEHIDRIKSVDKAIEQVKPQPVAPVEKPAEIFWVVVNGKKVEMNGDKEHYIFIDIFDYYAFDRTRPHGVLKLEVNGKKAAYLETLNKGDELYIAWE